MGVDGVPERGVVPLLSTERSIDFSNIDWSRSVFHAIVNVLYVNISMLLELILFGL